MALGLGGKKPGNPGKTGGECPDTEGEGGARAARRWVAPPARRGRGGCGGEAGRRAAPGATRVRARVRACERESPDGLLSPPRSPSATALPPLKQELTHPGRRRARLRTARPPGLQPSVPLLPPPPPPLPLWLPLLPPPHFNTESPARSPSAEHAVFSRPPAPPEPSPAGPAPRRVRGAGASEQVAAEGGAEEAGVRAEAAGGRVHARRGRMGIKTRAGGPGLGRGRGRRVKKLKDKKLVNE